MMKILHLSSEASWRGGEQQIAYLVEELSKIGVENTIACRTDSAFAAYCLQKNWEHVDLPFKGSTDLRTTAGIKKICKQEKVDLIHMHSAKSHSLAVLSHLLGNTTPLVLSRRVDFPIRNNFLTQWKYNHAAIKKIICVSHTIEQIVRRNIRRPERCLTIHSGIDLTRFQQPPSGYLRNRYHIPDEALLIGNTSAIAAHKDYYTFVDTAELFLKDYPAAYFLIIGEGPESKAIQQYIAQKGLSQKIILTGFLPNIPEILPELDIFLITSQTEGLGTSVLDAFACKVPVVATRAGGIPEMVIHERTGLLAGIKEAPMLAAHLKKITEDPSLRSHLVDNAYQHLLDDFTKENTASQTFRVYQAVLQAVRT